MNSIFLFLLFTGGVYVIAGTMSTLVFIVAYIWGKGRIKSHHDTKGGKVTIVLPNGPRGRIDDAIIEEAIEEAVKNGHRRPRIRKQ
jgi:hypothetical protein